MQKKAIILFSGGLDSTTCLAIAKADGFQCYALSFSYGQKHSVEIEFARRVAKEAGVIEHQILHLPLEAFKGSSLTDATLSVPNHQEVIGVPNTYVPARNTIFLSFALAWSDVIGLSDIFIGANVVDYSGYPDCRPAYLHAFEKVASLATKRGDEGARYRIHAPLLKMNKAEIIQRGIALGVDYSQTISCYRASASGVSCGQCDSCVYRKKGFDEAGVQDPTRYA